MNEKRIYILFLATARKFIKADWRDFDRGMASACCQSADMRSNDIFFCEIRYFAHINLVLQDVIFLPSCYALDLKAHMHF
jgi:hypothetical protein